MGREWRGFAERYQNEGHDDAEESQVFVRVVTKPAQWAGVVAAGYGSTLLLARSGEERKVEVDADLAELVRRCTLQEVVFR